METTSEPSMTPMNGLSKIPLQFIVEVTSGLSSCGYGLYRPQFIYPTPSHGEILNATAGSEFQLHISAQASYTSITDFKVSGPANLTRGGIFQSGSSWTKDIVIQWTPSDSDIGDHIPFCFIAETSQRYQSELRCVLVAVESRVDVSASHMQGGLMSYRFKGTNHNGALVVDFKYKAAFDQNNDYQFSWFCSSGDCGSVVYSSYAPVESSSYPRPWYQTEGHFIRHLYNDKPFQLSEGGCCWVNNKVGVSGWNLLTAVDLGIRSDTSTPNNPPETNIIPVIRVPQNCPSSLNLMAHDPDGDIVRCRYGEPLTGECNGCNKHQYFSLDQNRCILSLSSTISLGLYVMELVLEDFPQKDIYLRYRDGTLSYKYRPYGRKRREAANNPARYFWWTTDGYDFTDTTTLETSSVPDSYTTDEVSTQAISDVTTDFVHETTLWLTTDLPIESSSPTTSYLHTEPDTSSPTTTYPHTEPDTSSPTTTYLHTEPYTSSPPTTYLHATSVSISTPEAFPDTTLDTTTEAYTELITKTESTPSWHIPWTTQSWNPHTTHPTYEPTMPYLSKIPLQFIWEVTKAVPSCTYGEYRPKFLPPTPEQSKRLRARADTLFQIQLSAQALYSSITDFKVSGPSNITKRFTQNNTNSQVMTVEWTPSANDVGTHVPFCFLAETVDGYQSELRCIVIIVGPKISLNSTLMCNENTMTLIIEKSRESGLYENHLRLNDPRCLVSSNASHHIASVGFNSCGTQMEETENDIVFKNQITSFDNAYDVITRKHQVVIPFNCSFPKKTRVSAAFRAEKAVFEFTEAGFGNFTYKFQFYTDNQFTTVQTQYPLEVWLRDQLYMEVEVTSSVPNVQLFVESCKATPHDNPNDPVFYGIIDNGCLKDETLVIYPGTRTKSRFGMEAFAFIGNNEEVYVSCTVILCKFGDPNTRCSKGCLVRSSAEPDAYRHKRSLTPEASESLQHFISQGPLRMKRQSSKKDSGGSSELNVNTLVMSVSGVVIVALIAVTVYISMKKARMSRYKSLPTEDF
ncbi:uncharacterized protein LOC128467924 [Spea bombifrons]|uniref:uncharacterized protein LOC128467924 n=1 Tax=Spea bombifrons TaxID=233779 RepID=UPI00234B0222|nr:uncharacterized protein LOC128467924 [Spea bombifrons]